MDFKQGFVVVACAAVVAACSTQTDTAYKELDTNKDGMISQVEGQSMQGLTDHWSNLDVNMDGQLDKAEFAKFELNEQPAADQPEADQPEVEQPQPQEQAITEPEPVQQQ